VWHPNWEFVPAGIPRELWLHNLEHGGMALLWNCPSGCPEVTDALEAFRLGQRPDRFGLIRILGTPDLQMPRRVAAVAWGWRWQGDTVDLQTLQCLVDRRLDRAPESLP
jgi:hypothetical protein